ncbi:DNA polymerase III subunit beta [Methylobacterium sp. CM6244]
MRLTCERSALLKALSVTSRIVERRNTIPILSNALLTADGKRLTLRATNLDLEASTACAAEVAELGTTTVPAQMLRDIVGKLPEGAIVSLDKSEDNSRMVLKAGRSRFQIGTLPAEDFPDLQAGEMSHHFAWPVADVLRMVTETTFAISSEETRYYLNGVYLHAWPEGDHHNGLRTVATDGHKLSRLTLPRPEGAAGMPGIILPRKLVEELKKVVTTDGAAFFQVAVSTTKIRLERDDLVLTSKLIDGTFPDYQRVIPAENGNRLTLARADFASALDRVKTVSGGRGRAVKLDITEAGVTLSQHNPDSGDATDEVDGELDGKPLSIGFNGDYLAEILTVLDADAIEIALGDPGSPTILTRKNSDDLTIVLMPMRV